MQHIISHRRLQIRTVHGTGQHAIWEPEHEHNSLTHAKADQHAHKMPCMMRHDLRLRFTQLRACLWCGQQQHNPLHTLAICSHYPSKTGNTGQHASTWRALLRLALPRADRCESGFLHPLQAAHHLLSNSVTRQTIFLKSFQLGQLWPWNLKGFVARHVKIYSVFHASNQFPGLHETLQASGKACPFEPKCRLQHNHNSKSDKIQCMAFWNWASECLVQHGHATWYDWGGFRDMIGVGSDAQDCFRWWTFNQVKY